MADFLPVEANKARLLLLKVPAGVLPAEDRNAEWVEIAVNEAGDLANWRLQRLRALWNDEVGRPADSEWIYTFGAPAFVAEGEIYRIHSGSRVRAATHPLADDLATGRKHVYVAGPEAAARQLWVRGDYVRLVDAFGTVIDEVVVWPPEESETKEPARPV